MAETGREHPGLKAIPRVDGGELDTFMAQLAKTSGSKHPLDYALALGQFWGCSTATLSVLVVQNLIQYVILDSTPTDTNNIICHKGCFTR